MNGIIIRTVENLQKVYPNASTQQLQEYIDLRKEGYNQYQAKVMSGLSDPDEDTQP